jgi:hypothetical protein
MTTERVQALSVCCFWGNGIEAGEPMYNVAVTIGFNSFKRKDFYHV